MRPFQTPVENRKVTKMVYEGKEAFKLHCALIAAQDGVRKIDAPWQAWLEGKEMIEQRLGRSAK